ncbi:YaaL family protein [Virgibacillus kimchii]
MARKIKKKDIDKQLLDTIYSLQSEWKQVQSIIDQSMEPTITGYHQAKLLRAQYLFLLREARHRNVSAKDY